jgi:hypothetical protein
MGSGLGGLLGGNSGQGMGGMLGGLTGTGSGGLGNMTGMPGLDSQAGGGGGIMSLNGGINLSGIPFIGGMFPNPNEAAMQQGIKNVQAATAAYRPQMAQAYQNLAGDQLAALQGPQQALLQMYGGQPPPGPSISNPSHGGSPSMQASSPPPQASGGSSGGSSGGFLGGMLGGDPLGGLMGAGGLGGILGGGGMTSGLPGFGNGQSGGPLGGILGGMGPIGKMGAASMNPLAGNDANHVMANMFTGGLASLLGGR